MADKVFHSRSEPRHVFKLAMVDIIGFAEKTPGVSGTESAGRERGWRPMAVTFDRWWLGMRDCVVLGCARNGTSVLAGMISRGGGHWIGSDPMPASPFNRTGYFESLSIIDINDRMLSWFDGEGALKVGEGERWLTVLPRDELRFPELPEEMVDGMREQVALRPLCLKDPRFSYTLAAWNPLLGDALRVCVFRSPEVAARSLVRLAHGVTDVALDIPTAYEVWMHTYEYILCNQLSTGDWLFVDYDTLHTAATRERVEARTEGTVDWSLFSPKAPHEPAGTVADPDVPDRALALHGELVKMAAQ